MDPKTTSSIVKTNKRGGVYSVGKAFSEDKWVLIIREYREEILREGECTTRRLAELCQISQRAACRAIGFAKNDRISLPRQGTPLRGPGSLIGLCFEQHRFIYDMYIKNPAATAEQYIVEFYREYDLVLSKTYISRWFHTIGPFRGTLCTNSVFPAAKNTVRVLQKVIEYFEFISTIRNQACLVFANEKPLKPIDLFRLVRRDPFTGIVPDHKSDAANRKARYNIFAAVTVKTGIRRNVEYLLLEENGDAYLFREFVFHLIAEGALREGDVLVLDNCTIHFGGENSVLEEELWAQFHILMVQLPLYHLELNPTEYVFGHLVCVLRNKWARATVENEDEFLNLVEKTIDDIPFHVVYNQFKHCGYLKNY